MNECVFSAKGQRLTAEGTVEFLPNNSETLSNYFCAAQLLLGLTHANICFETQKEECRIYNKFAGSIDIKNGVKRMLIASKKVLPTS